MGKAEYTSHVRGMGPGHLPVKGSTHANKSSAFIAQVPSLVEHVNQQDQYIVFLAFAYNNVLRIMETLPRNQEHKDVYST
jgi:hypothetical protein